MDSLFRKCEQDTRAEAARLAGIYPYFHRLESRQDVEVVMDGRRRWTSRGPGTTDIQVRLCLDYEA